MTEPKAQDDDARDFAAGLTDQADVAAALDRLLAITGARATGLWKASGDALTQVGFRTVADMPTEVREGFRDVTQRLPLARTDLGVVKAAVSGEPVPAYLEAGSGDLAGSASWLARFTCHQSLAVPIYSGDTLRGVVAISTPEEFTGESETWKYMTELAQAIGHDL